MNIYRGTTPTISFKIHSESLDLNEIKSLWLTIKSKTHEKTYYKDKVIINTDSRSIDVYMTQEDTLAFKGPRDEDVECEVQFRILLNDDTALASKTMTFTMDRILKEGVIE